MSSCIFLQIAENVKEFFHNEGIHSTTIQPEFVEVNGQGNILLKLILYFSKLLRLRSNPPETFIYTTYIYTGKKGYGFHGFGSGPLNEDDCVLGMKKYQLYRLFSHIAYIRL